MMPNKHKATENNLHSIKKINILADENIVGLDVFFNQAALGIDVCTLLKKPGRAMQAADLSGIHILLVRSVTAVNAQLLGQAEDLLFVGSTTIGTDHVDLNYLAARDIQFACAPGCNAQGVCEYVMAAMAYSRPQIFQQQQAWIKSTLIPKTTQLVSLAENKSVDTPLKVALLGYGNTGSRVYKVLSKLNIDVSVCDPFHAYKAQQNIDDKYYSRVKFIKLEELVDADIISLHVPLTHQGDYPTYQLFSERLIKQLKPTALLINTSRGEVIDEGALLAFAQQHPELSLVLDVWENEPLIEQSLVERSNLASAHIAGYSAHGKWRGTLQIYQALYAQLNNETKAPLKSAADFPHLQQTIHVASLDKYEELFYKAYNIAQDDRLLRTALSGTNTAAAATAFDQLRKNYRQRKEWSQTQVSSADQRVTALWQLLLAVI